MPRVIIQYIMVVALTFSLGGHWCVLQVYAWATMIQKSAPEVGLSIAVAETLSGEKPCELCRGIQAARGQESSEEAPMTLAWKIKKGETTVAAEKPFVLQLQISLLPIVRQDLSAPDSLQTEVALPPPKLG